MTEKFTVKLVLCCLLCLLPQSCGKDYYYFEADCSVCYTEKPSFGDLSIRLNQGNLNRLIPVTIYRDDFEQNLVVWSDTVSVSSFTLEVEVNRYYSGVAEYSGGGKVIFAVDGSEFRVKKVVGQCDETCWVYTGGELDLRLKY